MSAEPIWNRFFELTSMRVPGGSVSVISVGKGVSPLPGLPLPPPPPPHAASSRHSAAVYGSAHDLLRVSCIELAPLLPARPRSFERARAAHCSEILHLILAGDYLLGAPRNSPCHVLTTACS